MLTKKQCLLSLICASDSAKKWNQTGEHDRSYSQKRCGTVPLPTHETSPVITLSECQPHYLHVRRSIESDAERLPRYSDDRQCAPISTNAERA